MNKNRPLNIQLTKLSLSEQSVVSALVTNLFCFKFNLCTVRSPILILLTYSIDLVLLGFAPK